MSDTGRDYSVWPVTTFPLRAVSQKCVRYDDPVFLNFPSSINGYLSGCFTESVSNEVVWGASLG